MRAVLDPKTHLRGATPETLARALLRPLRSPRPARQPVVRDKLTVEKVPTDEQRSRVSHLNERP